MEVSRKHPIFLDTVSQAMMSGYYGSTQRDEVRRAASNQEVILEDGCPYWTRKHTSVGTQSIKQLCFLVSCGRNLSSNLFFHHVTEHIASHFNRVFFKSFLNRGQWTPSCQSIGLYEYFILTQTHTNSQRSSLIVIKIISGKLRKLRNLFFIENNYLAYNI